MSVTVWRLTLKSRPSSSPLHSFLHQMSLTAHAQKDKAGGDEPISPDKGMRVQMAEQQQSISDEMKNAVEFVDSILSEPCIGNDVNIVSSKNDGQRKRRKSSDKVKCSVGRRASKRLAGIGVEVPPQPRIALECKPRGEATTSSRCRREAKIKRKEHDEKDSLTQVGCVEEKKKMETGEIWMAAVEWGMGLNVEMRGGIGGEGDICVEDYLGFGDDHVHSKGTCF